MASGINPNDVRDPLAPWCDACGRASRRRTGRDVYPKRPDLAGRVFYVCPSCDARVGCHVRTGRPFGPLANAELRALRMRCHAAFDPLWLRAAKHLGPQARSGAYVWLAAELGVERVHFGEADAATCRRVLALLSFLDNPPAVALLLALGEDARREQEEHFLDDVFAPGDEWWRD